MVTAGTGPVGLRAAGLLAKAGVDVTFTSRRAVDPGVVEGLQQRFGGRVAHAVMTDSTTAASVLEGATMLLNAGPAGRDPRAEVRVGRAARAQAQRQI